LRCGSERESGAHVAFECGGRADRRLWDSWRSMEEDETVWGEAMKWFRDVA